MFAKLYDTKAGQVLVKSDMNDEGGPEVRFYFQPPDLGICSVAYTFEDTKEGWDKRDKFLFDVNPLQAEAIAADKINEVMNIVGD